MGTGGKNGHTELIGNHASHHHHNIHFTSEVGFETLVVCLVAAANSISNFSDLSCGEAMAPMKDAVSDPSMWLVHQSLDDFRCGVYK